MTSPAPTPQGATTGPARRLVLTDLDGTIVHSRRRVADDEVDGLVVVERYEDRDVGFMSPGTWKLLGELQDACCVVPATARTIRQYRRIRFPRTPPVALLAGGTVILVDDEVDPVWAAETERRIAATGTTAQDVVDAMASLPTTEAPRNGDDRFAYVRVADGADLTEFEAWCTERSWRLVRQDGRVYVLPADLSKHAAVARVAELLDAEPALALGDGLMDLELLSGAPHSFTPAAGPLWASGWRGGTATDGTGPAGAETLLRAASDWLHATPLPDRAAIREEHHAR